MRRRQALSLWLAFCAAGAAGPARAHGSRLGDIVIDHPYAVPATAGATGALYFRTLTNAGRQADRLIGAQSAVATSVQIERGTAGGAAPDLRVIDALDLPPGTALKLRHDGDTRLALVGLKVPLRDGDRFTVRLRFERAGEQDVTAWVQQPR